MNRQFGTGLDSTEGDLQEIDLLTGDGGARDLPLEDDNGGESLSADDLSGIFGRTARRKKPEAGEPNDDGEISKLLEELDVPIE